MSQNDFEQLLDAMPRIAEAINSFTSEEVQQQAFTALIHTLGVPNVVPPPNDDTFTETSDQLDIGQGSINDEQQVDGQAKRKTGTTRRTTKRQWTPDRNMDFWPEGRQSFKDFVDEKKPGTIDQKNLIAIFWLEQVSDLTEIGVSQVLAAYKAVDWAEPSQPDVRLRNTASKEHWIDTASIKDLKTTPGGRNMVNQRMPIEKAKK